MVGAFMVRKVKEALFLPHTDPQHSLDKARIQKKEAIINSNREMFIEGAVERGMDKKKAIDIWHKPHPTRKRMMMR